MAEAMGHDGIGEGAREIALLLTAGGRDGEDGGNERVARGAVRAEATLAP